MVIVVHWIYEIGSSAEAKSAALVSTGNKTEGTSHLSSIAVFNEVRLGRLLVSECSHPAAAHVRI